MGYMLIIIYNLLQFHTHYLTRVDARLRTANYVECSRNLRTLRSQAHRLIDLRNSDRIDIHSRVTKKDYGALRDYVLTTMEIFADLERVIPNIDRDSRFDFEKMNTKDIIFLAIIWISVICLIGLSIVFHNNAPSRRRRHSVSIYRTV
nr:membrane protein e145 [Murid betaherpesvirus 8]WPH25311.1 membrane protein e145 [Murid betaherpesvirus 8]WPH25444.1 membrane protein e145 [Murid betaherpesvirus 8]